jgi:cation:H+ antiporter
MFLTIFHLIIGIALVVISADYFIAGSSLIAKRFGIPKLIIGLTIVAIGTSAPEFGVNVISSIQGHSGLALGNVLGSNISNILFIFAGAALFTQRVIISRNSLTQVSLGLLITIVILCVGMFSLGLDSFLQITQLEGVALLVIGLFYWFYLYKITQADTERLESDDLEENKLRAIKSFGLLITIIIISLIALLYGSHLVTNSAVTIAQLFGISELVIAGTIIAIGTSLPELVTSIQAARQKQYDLMIGNIVGSNIVNTLFILGTSAVIHAIPINKDGVSYLMMNTLASVLILVGFTLFEPRTFKRWQTILLLCVYVLFLIMHRH